MRFPVLFPIAFIIMNINPWVDYLKCIADYSHLE